MMFGVHFKRSTHDVRYAFQNVRAQVIKACVAFCRFHCVQLDIVYLEFEMIRHLCLSLVFSDRGRCESEKRKAATATCVICV